MGMKDLKQAYKTIEADNFAPKMEISFIDGDKRNTLCYEKVLWNIDGVEKGLRYGEDPGQQAALYRVHSALTRECKAPLKFFYHVLRLLCNFPLHRLLIIVPHIGKQAVLRLQLVKPSVLDHFAVAQDEDAVGICDG